MEYNKEVFKVSKWTLAPHIFFGMFIMYFNMPFVIMKLNKTRIILDEGMLYYETGIFSKERQSTPINQIQSINVKQSFLAQGLGYGDIVITTASSAGYGYAFKKISQPEKLRKSLNRRIAKLNKR